MAAPTTMNIDGVDFVRKDAIPEIKTGPESIIRTYSAGVHIGTIKSIEGQVVTLSNARRLWKWAGAFTLNEVATRGVNRANSRISQPVSEIVLFQAIEVIPLSDGLDFSPTEK